MSPVSVARTKTKIAAKSAAKSKSKSRNLKEESYARVGEAAVLAKTGKRWREWFAILDRAGAHAWPHREIAEFLDAEHGLSEWWSQMVTVGYEQARGLRQEHQRTSGFAVSASKTIEVPVAKLFDAWSNASTRRRWLGGTDLTVRKASRPKVMRIAWKDGSSVSVSFLNKGRSKSQVTIEHEKLKASSDVARLKKTWGGALQKLKEMLESS
jgi:uncharacterized protein YndB with AHSA1/START domain